MTVHMQPLPKAPPGMRWEPCCEHGSTGHLQASFPTWWPIRGGEGLVNGDAPRWAGVDFDGKPEPDVEAEALWTFCGCEECESGTATHEDPLRWPWWTLVPDEPPAVDSQARRDGPALALALAALRDLVDAEDGADSPDCSLWARGMERARTVLDMTRGQP